MKKKFYFATLVITALSFTGCANDEYVGDQQKLGEQNGAIAFSTKSENTVRATWENDKAAEKLNKQFWVYGTKTVGENDPQPVFKDYKVVYDNDNANKSTSNTKGWEYVGIPGTNQTIKYWDYSASQYDFEAYSIKNGEGTVTRIANDDQRENGLAEGDYEVKGISQNGCANLYFAEKNTVSKSDYNKAVKLSFKSVLSKIRVGFYETIPGYSVKITNFYKPNGAASGSDDGTPVTDRFVAWCPNKALGGRSDDFVVSYVNVDGKITPAVTKFCIDGQNYKAINGSVPEYKLNSTLELGSNLIYSKNGSKEIGNSYSKVTWDKVVINTTTPNTTTPDYTYFIPQNDDRLMGSSPQVQPMRIKVDYTLTSTDGSKEEIHVKGATAIVPAEYLRWKPNTAYSYVFKISDNTNGSTGTDPDDPAGLYPITFDAVVEDMAEYKDHLTTVSELSITATQGGQFADADKAVFKTGEAINVKVMKYDDNNVASDITSDQNAYHFYAAFVTAYDYDKSQEDNLNGQRLDSPINPVNNYITLEGKSAGYWIVKVTYTADGKNITKYAVLKVGTETTSTSGNGAGGGE